jgi:hypothetical protein
MARHGASGALSKAGIALVARDHEQPCERLPRCRAVQERAVRGEEDLLRRVLRLGAVAEERAAERCNRGSVLSVERLGVV